MVVENKLRVRKYYANHSKEILGRKILYSIKTTGRVPRFKTLKNLEIDLRTIVDAFHAFLLTEPTSVDFVSQQIRKLKKLCLMDFFMKKICESESNCEFE